MSSSQAQSQLMHQRIIIVTDEYYTTELSHVMYLKKPSSTDMQEIMKTNPLTLTILRTQ